MMVYFYFIFAINIIFQILQGKSKYVMFQTPQEPQTNVELISPPKLKTFISLNPLNRPFL